MCANENGGARRKLQILAGFLDGADVACYHELKEDVRMKRIIVVLMMLVLGITAAVATGLMSGEGAPLEELAIYVDLAETELSSPQTVEVTLTVRNLSDEDRPGPLKLYYPDGTQIVDFGAPILKANEQREWTGTWFVTQEQLDAGQVCFGVQYIGLNPFGVPVVKEGYVAAGIISVDADVAQASPVLVLRSGPSTGYDWSWKSDNENVLAVNKKFVADRVSSVQAVVPMVGGGGRDLMTLSGLNAGETTVTFTYKRSWEENALYTLVYHVRVDEDLNVIILSSSFDW